MFISELPQKGLRVNRELFGMMYRRGSRLLLIATCFVFIIVAVWFSLLDSPGRGRTAFIEVVPGESRLYFEDLDLVIYGWDSYGVTYFFIPSYARISGLDFSGSKLKIYDKNGVLLETPEFNTVQEVLVDSEDGELIPYKLGIYQSDGLYTINITADQNDLDSLNTRDYISVSISMISPSGAVEYSDSHSTMKGRGNSSWDMVLKKSYDIRLAEEYPLLKETKSNKWALLANALDNTKICNKMVLDTAADIGMPYITESDWADVYINGVYNGNYLICKEPHVSSDDVDIGNLQKENNEYFDNAPKYDKGNIKGYDYKESVPDITGGYLFSVGELYRERNCGFYLPSGISFYLKSPDNASKREMEYISSYIERIDRSLAKTTDSIDRYSFARRFLIDEIFFDDDSQVESYFFYKRKGDDTLYAGPCWDYDRLLIWMGPVDTATASSVLDEQGGLMWDKILMEDSAYRDYVKDVFIKNEYLWDQILNYRIDRYFARIRASVKMDSARWDELNEEIHVLNYSHYSLPESNIKLMKYLLHKRLKYLSDRYDPTYDISVPKIKDGLTHKVMFVSEDSIKEFTLMDGDFISDKTVNEVLPETGGWINEKTGNEFSPEYPVYEDAVYKSRDLLQNPDLNNE